MQILSDSDAISLFIHMVELARAERFEEIRDLARVDRGAQLASLGPRGLRLIRDFWFQLPFDEADALIKAIAVYEETARFTGSISFNRDILTYRTGGDNTTLDWVLRNTNYWYYGKKARSLAEYEADLAESAARQAAAYERDYARHVEAAGRHAVKATQVLFNAVRRKDVKAVAALLAKGADPSVCGPDGRSVMNLAVELGNVGIIEMLREASGTVQRDINKQHKS
jgi:hypothetical protein